MKRFLLLVSIFPAINMQDDDLSDSKSITYGTTSRYTNPIPDEQMWAMSFRNTIVDSGCSAVPVQGGYAMVGNTFNLNGNSDFWVAKTDEYANTVREMTYDTGNHDVIVMAKPTSDGGLVFCGQSDIPPTYRTDSLIVKLGPDGTVQWVNQYGTDSNDYLYSIEQTFDGGFIASGARLDGLRNHTWIIRIDSSGNTAWEKTFPYSHSSRATTVSQCSDGSFIVIGDYLPFPAADYHVYLLKLDQYGNIMWSNTYDSLSGASDFAYSVRESWVTPGYLMAWTTGISWGSMTVISHVDASGNFSDPVYDFSYVLITSGPNYPSMVQLDYTDGSYLVAGNSTTTRSITLTKFSITGVKQWEKFYRSANGSAHANPGSVIKTRAGYLLVGGTYTTVTGSEMWIFRTTGFGEITFNTNAVSGDLNSPTRTLMPSINPVTLTYNWPNTLLPPPTITVRRINSIKTRQAP
ncbi:MAG: hypothetical protein HY606_07185 [Planctomycetes bacterium]|nr:hypothetical protein [Planctomycetota bacterium]